VLDENSLGVRLLGGAAKWWLHGALSALSAALSKRGGCLATLRGPSAETIEAVAAESHAVAVYWNRCYDQAGRAIGSSLKAKLKQRGIAAYSFNGSLLREPWEVMSPSGGVFRTFSRYWNAAEALGAPPAPQPAPRALRFHPDMPSKHVMSVELAALELEPTSFDLTGGLCATWRRGEDAARKRLEEFLADQLRDYAVMRDRPDRTATSRLSPHLRFGEISPRQIRHRVKVLAAANKLAGRQSDLDKFITELGWREFNYYLLYHFPDLACENMRASWNAMPWRSDPAALRAWQRGLTGYPIVDAGMRELWATGWMHNRVRMIVASFLVKHLLIDWRVGEAWFWDTLVDADVANNPANWQWVAGSGSDAVPFFRIFNPILQGAKFDPTGNYVRRWVPELAKLPSSVLHQPWTATLEQLSAAEIRLGETYPLPIVVHAYARQRALDHWRTIVRQ
jgi:deoxyribodipyrimidine photo-lyase